MTNTQNNISDASFAALLAAVSDDDAKARAAFYAAQCDERAAYEATKNADNESIQKHVKNAAKRFAALSVARFMIAADVRAEFVNEQERVNARRNIYSVAKLLDVAESVTRDKAHNAINHAVIASLFRFETRSLEFTHADALCAASKSMTVKDAAKRSALVRHIVSASTASTQASSTMNALRAAHIVSEYENDNRETCYRLNDNALVSHLREQFKAA